MTEQGETPGKPSALTDRDINHPPMGFSDDKEANEERSDSYPKPSLPSTERNESERMMKGECNLLQLGQNTRVFTDTEELHPFGLHAQSDMEEYVRVSKKWKTRRFPLVIEMVQEHKAIANGKEVYVYRKMLAEGQGCLVRTPQGVVILTAKHNFCSHTNKDGVKEICKGVSVVEAATQSPFALESDNIKELIMTYDVSNATHTDENAISLNPTSGAGWKYGRDLISIPLPELTRLREFQLWIDAGLLCPFDAIGPDVVLQEGLRIGIMVCSAAPHKGLAERIEESFAAAADYAPAVSDTFIMVGKITHVGEDHIGYTVNTFPGFSGGPVFLLPNDEQDETYMKLVAIHAGYSRALGSKFGFLSSKELEKYAA
ncbi:MAG: hypothetical protein SGILL_007315 [Bacillariaceae sp.]